MLVCLECGRICEEPATCAQYFGECHGRPVYTYNACCPRCGGELEELEE